MADNYLITGYWGEPHVTAENDRGINAAIFGTGRFVLPVGEQFRAEFIGNNTIRIHDGKLMNNGAAAGIPAGKYIDLSISEAAQNMKRNDLIVFQYKRDSVTLVESGTFVVVKGAETSSTAKDPTLTQNDLMTDEATFDQMALWRVPVSGSTISDPVKVFNVHGLTNVSNTPDAEKSVSYADSAGKVKNALSITVYDGATGGITMYNYDGSYTEDIDLSASKLGASKEGHTHNSLKAVTTTGTGAAYEATVPDITKLQAGVNFIMIPHTTSTTNAPTLNVNSLGAKNLRQPLSLNTTATTTAELDTWLSANKPVHVIYDGTLWKINIPRPSASNLYGTVPIESGGTGATTAEAAREALGAVSMEELPNLCVWIVLNGTKSSMDSFTESEVTNVKLSDATNMGGSVTTNNWETISYAVDVTYESGTLALLNPTSKTINGTSGLDTLLRGQYIKLSGGTIYRVPSDATFTSSTSGQTTTITVSKLTTVNSIGRVRYQVTKERNAFVDGSNTSEGYKIYYHKRLCE